MKLKRYSWLAVLPMIFTACQDDMLVENNHQGIKTLTATMNAGSASRAQIILNGSDKEKEIFHWNAEDAFTLFLLADENNNLSSQIFTISDTYADNNPTANAQFSTLGSGIDTKRDYVAFYPSQKIGNENEGQVSMTINNTLENNESASWVDYFKNNMFMKAKKDDTNPTSVHFEQLCGIIRITYKNESGEDRTFDRIGVDGSWTTGGYYKLPNTSAETFVGNVSVNDFLGLQFTQKATVKAGSTENFYILYLKNATTGEKTPMSQVFVEVDLNDKSTAIYSPTRKLPLFETGKCYRLNITDTGDELLWTNNTVGDDEVEEGDEERNQWGQLIKRVSTFEQLKAALSIENEIKGTCVYVDNIESDEPFTIEMTEPLIVKSHTNLYLCNNTLSLSENYNSESSVFILQNGLVINSGNIQGLENTTTNQLPQYFFESTNHGLEFNGVTFNAGKGITNGAKLTNASFRAKNNSNITMQETSGKAIDWYFTSTDRIQESDVHIQEGAITGNIGFTCNVTNLDTKINFMSGTINGNLNTDCESVSSIVRKAADVSIPDTYKTTWDKAGVFYNDQIYEEVNDWTKLKTALTNSQQGDEKTEIHLSADIVLESPLTISKPVILWMSSKKLTLKSDFNFGDSEAVLTSTTGDFEIYEGTIEGTTPNVSTEGSTTIEKKYLLKKIDGKLYLDQVDLNANTSTEQSKGNAVSMLASTVHTDLSLWESTVNGNVSFNANFSSTDSRYPNIINVENNSSITGDLLLDGNYKNNVVINVNRSTVEGVNWEEAALNRLKYEFTQNGNTGVENLTLKNNETIEFTIGNTSTNEDGNKYVYFDAYSLNGTGTIKFVNSSNDNTFKPYIRVFVENLGDNVKLDFEGNFHKDISVCTSRIKEFFEMADNIDKIRVSLPSDVTLTEQIITGNSLKCGENYQNKGILALELNGHTLTSSMDTPAIIHQGGNLYFDSGWNMDTDSEWETGTIINTNTNTSLIQMGAQSDDNNNTITLSICHNLTINSTEPWINVKVDAPSVTSHKNIEAFIKNVTNYDETLTKIKVSNDYTGNVSVNGNIINGEEETEESTKE